MAEQLTFELLSERNIQDMALLGKEYNQKLTILIIEEYLHELFSFGNYHCFGVFLEGKLIGFASGWITIKFSIGKLLELDNIVVTPPEQSRDMGTKFFSYIEVWAKKNSCKAVEINTLLQSSAVHRFLMNLDYSIVGLQFQKLI